MTFGLLKKSWGKSHHLHQLHVANKRLFTTKMISSDESGKTDIEVEDEDNDWTSLPEFISTSDQVHRSIETTIRRDQLRDQRRELRFLSIKTKAKKQVASKKQRNVEMWNRLTEEEKLTQKLLRQQRQELSENRLKHAMISGINVCVELAFDEENSEKERKSLWKQLSLTYGILKKAQTPCHLHVTSYEQSSQTGWGLQSQGLLNWHASLHNLPSWEAFNRERIIILSPDADEVLEELSAENVYVIGGIVDRTIRKGGTLQCAEREKLRSARLPIREYLGSRQSHILNIDTVVGVLCAVQETGNWAKALEEYMPDRRKVAGGKPQRRQNRLSEEALLEGDEDGERDGGECGSEYSAQEIEQSALISRVNSIGDDSAATAKEPVDDTAGSSSSGSSRVAPSCADGNRIKDTGGDG